MMQFSWRSTKTGESKTTDITWMFESWRIKERLCQNNLSQESQIEIHKHFWGLSKELQNQWISHKVDTVNPAGPRKKSLERKERKINWIFHVEKGRTWKSSIWLRKFLETLGITGDRSIQTVLLKIRTSRWYGNTWVGSY